MYDLNAKIELPKNIFFVYTLLASCHMAKLLAFGRAKPLSRSIFCGKKIRSATAAELTNVRCAKPTHYVALLTYIL